MFDCRGSYVTFLCEAEMAAPHPKRASTPTSMAAEQETDSRAVNFSTAVYAVCLEHRRTPKYPLVGSYLSISAYIL